jgi:hypothetical protein
MNEPTRKLEQKIKKLEQKLLQVVKKLEQQTDSLLTFEHTVAVGEEMMVEKGYFQKDELKSRLDARLGELARQEGQGDAPIS